MAQINSYQLKGTGTLALGSASQDDKWGGFYLLHVVDTGSWSGSLLIKGSIHGLEPTELTTEAVTLPYINRSTGASVAAGTPITAEGLYMIPVMGENIFADYTHTSGSGVMYFLPSEGVALTMGGSGGGGGGDTDVNITEVGGDPVLPEGLPVTTRPAPTLAFGQVNVTSTSAEVRPMSPLRRGLSIRNLGPNTVYLGVDGSVSDSDGYAVIAGAEGPAILGLCIDAIHVVCASGDTAKVTYWEA